VSNLFKKISQKEIVISKAAEVGVYYPQTSNIIDFIEADIPSILIEADPLCVERIHEYFRNRNITVYPYAIWDEEGIITLYRAGASTFVSSIMRSPAKTNDHYIENSKNSFTAEAKRFSSIDSGDIDLISIDIEGAEWYVLKHMISRPKFINIEFRADRYSNPFKKEIIDWLRSNNYTLWYHDDTDSVYYRNDVLNLKMSERIPLMVNNCIVIAQHTTKKIIKNLIAP
jgi:FkbM family methyltransferase